MSKLKLTVFFLLVLIAIIVGFWLPGFLSPI